MTGYPIPILRSFDEAKTKEFYIGFLGFEMVFEYKQDPSSPLYMGVIRDDCTLHISEHHGDSCPGSALRIEVEDVDNWCRELNAKGYKNARPAIIEQPWGYREMVISDPAGNRLTFCTPVA